MDAYLKIEGIDGPSKEKDMEGHFDILSYNHGGSVPTRVGERDRGRLTLSTFSVTRLLDKATPELWAMLTRNESKNVTLKLVRVTESGGEKEVFMTYALEPARITDISVTGGTGGEAVENISFEYENITWTYNGEDGQKEHTYDLEKRISG